MEIISAGSSVMQFGYGFKLLLEFTDPRADTSTPINEVGDTWLVLIVKPNGTVITKTTSLEFPDDAIPAIAVPIDALDLDVRGTYYFQVAKTTAGAQVLTEIGSFEVAASLPDDLEASIPSSPFEDFFPMYNAQGGLTPSLLEVVGSTLYFDGVAIGGTGTTVDLVIGEVPSGLVNGSNATFTTAFSFDPDTIDVFVNGLKLLKPDEFTTTGTTQINLTFSPATGEVIQVNYQKA
jgi:hypothetical protein